MKIKPEGHWLWGHLLNLWQDPLATFSETYRLGGPVVRLRLGGMSLFLICHPDHIRQVLQSNNRNYVLNRRIMPLARAIMGTNLVTSDGEFWAKHRRILQPAFAPDRLSQFVSPVVAATRQMLQSWEVAARQSQCVDVAVEFRGLALKIAADTLMGSDLTEAQHQIITDGITAGMKYFAYRTQVPVSFPLWFPSPYNVRVKAIRKRTFDLIDSLIAQRRRNPSTTDDLLQRLVDAQDPQTGQGLSDEEIRYEVIGVLTAASETTANALSWTSRLLCMHPDELDKVRQEIDSVLAGREPEYADVENLRYTRMALDEGIRLFPPTWVMGRTAVDHDKLGETSIPAGSHLAISPYVTHRLEQFWDEPTRFDPNRFSDEANQSRHPFAYYPFGAGPRACIGRYLSRLEMPIVMSLLIQRFDLRLDSSVQVKPEPLLSLRPGGGVHLHLSLRKST